MINMLSWHISNVKLSLRKQEQILKELFQNAGMK